MPKQLTWYVLQKSSGSRTSSAPHSHICPSERYSVIGMSSSSSRPQDGHINLYIISYPYENGLLPEISRRREYDRALRLRDCRRMNRAVLIVEVYGRTRQQHRIHLFGRRETRRIISAAIFAALPFRYRSAAVRTVKFICHYHFPTFTHFLKSAWKQYTLCVSNSINSVPSGTSVGFRSTDSPSS